MRSELNIDQFLKLFSTSLKLTFYSKKIGLDNTIQLSTEQDQSYEVVDFLNFIRPSSVIILGDKETHYLKSINPKKSLKLLEKLFDAPIFCFILSCNETLPDALTEYIESRNFPIFQSALFGSELLENCRYYLTRALAEHTIEHGVFIEVHSVGIFITGDSGTGKSELALALLTRGHRLISDDVTQFTRVAPDTLDGHSPGILSDFMEVRGLGILNIRAMFGSNAIKRNKTLRLNIHLTPYNFENQHQFDRLGLDTDTTKILGIEIQQIKLPLAPGRNIAVLVEAAAHNHLLGMNGYNAAEDFVQRQRAEIQKNQTQS